MHLCCLKQMHVFLIFVKSSSIWICNHQNDYHISECERIASIFILHSLVKKKREFYILHIYICRGGEWKTAFNPLTWHENVTMFIVSRIGNIVLVWLCRWHTWTISGSVATFWIWWLSTWFQLSVPWGLCRQRKTEYRDNMPTTCIQDQVSGELFSS